MSANMTAFDRWRQPLENKVAEYLRSQWSTSPTQYVMGAPSSYRPAADIRPILNQSGGDPARFDDIIAGASRELVRQRINAPNWYNIGETPGSYALAEQYWEPFGVTSNQGRFDALDKNVFAPAGIDASEFSSWVGYDSTKAGSPSSSGAVGGLGGLGGFQPPQQASPATYQPPQSPASPAPAQGQQSATFDPTGILQNMQNQQNSFLSSWGNQNGQGGNNTSAQWSGGMGSDPVYRPNQPAQPRNGWGGPWGASNPFSPTKG